MADLVTAPEATEPTAPVEEKPVEKKEAPKPKIDTTRPLSQQTKILSDLMGDTTEPEEEKPEDEPKPEDKEEPKKEEPKVPAPASDEDEEIEPAKPVDLGPMEKYVVDRLPNITARIEVDGKQKVVQVKSDAQLPDGFTFVDDASRSQFLRDLTAQEIRANDLLKEYQGKQQQEAIREFQQQENEDVAADVARLQKQGILGEFDESTPATDENVKIANDIYDLYQKTNQAYAQRYMNTNRTFRISYADAADKYFAAKARTSPNESQKAKEQPKEEPAKKTPAQQEREEIAKRTGAPSNAEPGANRPKAQPGMSMNDINRLVRAGRI
jgi:hypothetical protein